MAAVNSNNRFALISQKGPFATLGTPMANLVFAGESREFARQLRAAGLITQYRVIRAQIFDFLNINSFAEIASLLADSEQRAGVNRRSYRLLGNMFGLRGSDEEIIATIRDYSRTADRVIRYLQGRVMAQYAPYIEMTNEIDITSSPVDLLLITFDKRYHQKARFEARRKLLLMYLAGSIDQRERETRVESSFIEFLDFLNEYVWSPDMLIGELEISCLLSRHSADNFACREVEVIPLKQGAGIKQKTGVKTTLIKRRRFKCQGREIPVYVSIRKKPPEAKVLKLLRKGEENPAVAVDDELGLMAVLDSIAEVRLFQAHLTRSAIQADSFMTLEDVSDTLTGGRYRSSNVGSSAHTPMFKFFARMGGMRVEFIIHTNRTYLDYIYQRGVSHDEYEVKRLFDSGVAELLFPPDIYGLNMAEIKESLIRACRFSIEGS
jgi:hypothetical protein